MSRKALGPLAAALAIALAAAGCAGGRGAGTGEQRSPADVYAEVLGRNAGLSSLRAVVEARFAVGGTRATLPGVLVLDSFGGFRLDVLDPVDRPVAIFFTEGDRIVQYRPGTGFASSLAVFTKECGNVGPEAWVPAVTASGSRPVAGERLEVRRLWGGERVLERSRDGELRQSVRLREEHGALVPRLVSWYCGGDAVMQLRPSQWIQAGPWRLPTRLSLSYAQAGLSLELELREIEGNPPSTGSPLRPVLSPETRWTSWHLPR